MRLHGAWRERSGTGGTYKWRCLPPTPVGLDLALVLFRSWSHINSVEVGLMVQVIPTRPKTRGCAGGDHWGGGY